MKNNCFKEAQPHENTNKQLNEIRKIIHEEIQKFNREIVIAKWNQTVILKLKNTVNGMKIVTESINNRLDQVEENISYLKDSSFETTQSEGKKK